MSAGSTFPLRPALMFGSVICALGMAAPGIAYALLGGPTDGGFGVPPLWPPQWAFWVVWLLLYPTMGVATAYVWRERERVPFARTALIIFAAHLLINISWVPIVQASQQPLIASVVMDFAVDIASVIAASAYGKVSRQALIWLVPYLSWELFTTTIKIWRLLLNT